MAGIVQRASRERDVEISVEGEDTSQVHDLCIRLSAVAPSGCDVLQFRKQMEKARIEAPRPVHW